MILVVSHSEDVQGDAVCRELERAGHAFRRIAPTTFGADSLYSMLPRERGFGVDRVFATLRDDFDGEPGAADPISAVYWRRPIRPRDRMAVAFPLAGEVARAEAYHAFRLAVEALPAERFPLGHPVPMERSSNKLLQLQVAGRMGMRTPDTLVSNDPAALRGFAERHRRLAIKPLNANACYKPENRAEVDMPLWCRGAEAAELLDRLPADRRTQLMLQERIEKVADWRITVLPHRSFYCRIDTAELPPEQPDWRRQPNLLQHELFDPPAGFDDVLRAYLAQLDLKAGYFDFAVPQGGEPVFLEVNTNAEWHWIEERTGAPIAAEVARTLAGG